MQKEGGPSREGGVSDRRARMERWKKEVMEREYIFIDMPPVVHCNLSGVVAPMIRVCVGGGLVSLGRQPV